MSVSTDRRRLLALWVIFFVNGAVLASWAPRIPEVKDRLHLSDGALGLALLGVAAGSVPALLVTGHILRRVPARVVCILASVAFPAALPLITSARGVLSLTIVLAVLGASVGCLDVAMNTAALEFEKGHGRPALSRLHGGYSLGVLAGAIGGSLATRLTVSVAQHFVVVAVLLCGAAVAAAPSLPRAGRGHTRSGTPARVPRGFIPASIAALAVAGLLVEGTLTDWSALLVARDFAGGPSLGALTVALFSLAMFVSRSLGDAIVARFGTVLLCRVSAAILVLSVLIGSAQSTAAGMAATCALLGLALGPLFPLAVRAAGRSRPGAAAAAAAQVSAVGYLAHLSGPPLVGALAELISLPLTIVVVTIAAGTTIALAARGSAR